MNASRTLLRTWLLRQLDAPQAAWLDAQATAITAGADGAALDIAFGLAPRKLGKAALALDGQDLAAADRAVQGWSPRGWSVADAARVLLLCSLPGGGQAFAERFRALCQSADMAELVALYRGLPLYPEPAALLAQVGEGLRSNMRAVFEAIAQHSPFPKKHFDPHRWNHMVLKALFIDSPLAPIQGLDERANPELARIMCDFAHERWAAGRPVPHEIWRCVGPFAAGPMLGDLEHALLRGTDLERQAAALGLAACPEPRAAAILGHAPELVQDIAADTLNWQSLA